jgi:hypothetical protein
MNRKVFCIGFNKTGTTSLEKVLVDLGFHLPQLGQQIAELVPALCRGDFQSVKRYIEQFDAFQDNPFSQGVTWAQMDVMFPGSKFILSVRDSESWYASYCRYALKLYGVKSLQEVTPELLKSDRYKNINHALFHIQRRNITSLSGVTPSEDWSLMYEKDRLIKIYEERNHSVVRHFLDRPEAILVLDVSKESDTAKLVNFLGLPRALIKPFPHLNKSQ